MEAPAAEISSDDKKRFFALWRLDTIKSDSLAPIMEVGGAPWFVRWMVGTAALDVDIKDVDGNMVEVTTLSRLRTDVQRFSTDKSVSESQAWSSTAKQSGWWERDASGNVCLHQQTETAAWKTLTVRHVREDGVLEVHISSQRLDSEMRASIVRYHNRVAA